MKKILTLILALCMAVSLTACGGGDQQTPETTPQDNQEEVVTPDVNEGGEETEWSYQFSKEYIDAIEEAIAQLEPLYNEAATLAIENGWDTDELTVKELNAVYALIETGKYGVADPSEYGETTDEDMAVIAEQYQVILGAMPALIERVSVPNEVVSGEGAN